MRLKVILITLIFSLFSNISFAAIDATTLWEIKATGASGNGGGFADLDPGTSVDYTDQDVAQLTINDGATAGIGNTTLTSAGGGFTAAMVGNVIQLLTGTNLTDGWYQITAYTDTNTVTLDRAPDDGVGGVSGADGKVGGALNTITDAFMEQLVAGNTVYLENEGGAITLTGTIDVLTATGTETSPIVIEGYNTDRGDSPIGTNRPLIAGGVYGIRLRNSYWYCLHLRITGTAGQLFRPETKCIVYNVHINNESTSANCGAFVPIAGIISIGCEAQSLKGEGFEYGNPGNSIIFSYIHDSKVGILTQNRNIPLCAFNIIDSCVTGINGSTFDSEIMFNNTIVNCTTAISGADGTRGVIFNNIFDNNITGATWTTNQGSNFFDYNIWNNTTDVTNVTKGDNAITADPVLGIALVSGADGTTDASDQTKFEAASNPFTGVTTNDVLLIHSGTGVTTGAYNITAVVDSGELTISTGATTGGSSIVYGIVKGSDFTVASGSNALDAALQIGTNQGATGDYKLNIGADQDDNTAGGGTDIFGWVD